MYSERRIHINKSFDAYEHKNNKPHVTFQTHDKQKITESMKTILIILIFIIVAMFVMMKILEINKMKRINNDLGVKLYGAGDMKGGGFMDSIVNKLSGNQYIDKFISDILEKTTIGNQLEELKLLFNSFTVNQLNIFKQLPGFIEFHQLIKSGASPVEISKQLYNVIPKSGILSGFTSALSLTKGNVDKITSSLLKLVLAAFTQLGKDMSIVTSSFTQFQLDKFGKIFNLNSTTLKGVLELVRDLNPKYDVIEHIVNVLYDKSHENIDRLKTTIGESKANEIMRLLS